MKRQDEDKKEDITKSENPSKNKSDEKMEREENFGSDIEKEDYPDYWVEEKIKGGATIGIKGSRGEVKGLPSIQDVESIIHLGEQVHTTITTFFEESQEKGLEIGGALMVTGEGRMHLYGKYEADPEIPTRLIIKRDFDPEQIDPSNPDDVAFAGTAHTHPVSGSPDPSIQDLLNFISSGEKIKLMQGKKLYSIVYRTKQFQDRIEALKDFDQFLEEFGLLYLHYNFDYLDTFQDSAPLRDQKAHRKAMAKVCHEYQLVLYNGWVNHPARKWLDDD